MELRTLPRRLGQGAAGPDRWGRDPRRSRDPLHLQTSVLGFSAADRHGQCQRCRVGGTGEILPGGRAGWFAQKPIGAGPYRLVAQEPGTRLNFEAFDDYYRPVHVKRFTIVSVPEAATRLAMIERGEADIMYFVPGELIERVKSNPKLMLAPVVSAPWWLEFPGL